MVPPRPARSDAAHQVLSPFEGGLRSAVGLQHRGLSWFGFHRFESARARARPRITLKRASRLDRRAPLLESLLRSVAETKVSMCVIVLWSWLLGGDPLLSRYGRGLVGEDVYIGILCLCPLDRFLF